MNKDVARIALWTILLTGTSCKWLGLKKEKPVYSVPTYSTFHQPDFSWDSVRRVVILPILNDTTFTRADDEVVRAFSTELQQLGKFEVIIAPADETAKLSTNAHKNGKFDERKLLELAQLFQADLLIYGTITQYSPYPRPRLGVVFHAVSPADLKTISTVDGVWDANDGNTANELLAYYRQKPVRRDWITNHVIPPEDGHADELALQSPSLFQRWVMHHCAGLLVQGYAVVPPEKP